MQVGNYYCVKRLDQNMCQISFTSADAHNAGLWLLTVKRTTRFTEARQWRIRVNVGQRDNHTFTADQRTLDDDGSIVIGHNDNDDNNAGSLKNGSKVVH